MPKSPKKREQAMRLFLTGECSSNAEIAKRLSLKPHTVGRWAKEDDWESYRLKLHVAVAEGMVKKLATERVSVNTKHYRIWDVMVVYLAEILKAKKVTDVRELHLLASVMDRAQKGQRMAKGLSSNGETEEAIRARAHADQRNLIDVFMEVLKENVQDEATRERISAAIVGALPEEEDEGAELPDDALAE